MQTTQSQKELAIETHSIQADEFAERYKTPATDAYGSCFNYSRKRLDVWLKRYLPERGDGLRLLDVGCGTGDHMARYRARGFEVAGVDGSEKMLEHARANNPGVEIHRADVEMIPFPDASFDFVVCIEVLRYLPDARPCIQEIARVLKPGGVSLVTAAPLLNLNGYWLVNRAANAVRIGDLVRLKQFFATSSELRREFEAAGFEKPAIHGVYFGPINWIERLAPRALPRLLKSWERLDASVSDAPLLREFSNMFLVYGVKRR